MSRTELTYVIYKYPSEINLDVFEAEKYEPAIVVQPLIGNLVYYSNHGRYEPRIASKWERSEPHIWTFYLREGFTCENGEKITAASFKLSLERMLYFLSKKGDSPVLNKLTGYKTFLNRGKDLEGIVANENQLSFHFDSPVRGGLIEVLSFAPYGYICSENLNTDGSWKDKNKFISSGPYRVSDFKIKEKYTLELRPEWEDIAHTKAPRIVNIVHDFPKDKSLDTVIVDSINPVPELTADFSTLKLVPEYLNAILFGNLEKGLFSKLSNRIAFKRLIEKFRNDLPETFKLNYRANSFYTTQNPPPPSLSHQNFELDLPIAPLIIEGTEPSDDSFKYETWITLKKALDEAGFKYQFAGNDQKWQSIRSGDFDLRLRCTSVGGSADAWGLDILFCSTIGPGYPDPNNKVCNLIKSFESNKLSESAFEYEFLKVIDEDAAIVPISHMGSQLFLGKKIKNSSLNPTLNIIRFDQVEVD